MTDSSHRDAVAIVTGGASGIGRATADLLLEQGAQVIIADLSDDAGEAWAADRDRGRFFKADMTEDRAVARLIASVIGAFGQIDLLFNNAGGTRFDTGLAGLDQDSLDQAVHQNLLSAGLGIKHAAPHMIERGQGCIINTGSVAATHPAMGSIAYSSAKAGLVQMTRTTAARLARHNIRVNCVMPGIIPTGFLGRTYGLDAEQAAKAEKRLRRMASKLQPLPVARNALDVARLVAFLAGEGGRFITGQSLVVDGGLTLGAGPEADGDAFEPLQNALGITAHGQNQ